jgi:anthranilate phosphoribosyltransferase
MHICLEKLEKNINPGSDHIKEYLHEIMNGHAEKDDIISFLRGLNKIDPTIDEISACVEVMREKASPVIYPEGKNRDDFILVDTCGTGGDNSKTINISTLTALGIAALRLDNVLVCKHGNRAVSSVSGSADLMERMGIDLTISIKKTLEILWSIGITFFFAPNWHPAMKHVAPARKEIAERTIFNILGPLSNPMGPQFQLIGVFSEELLDIYAKVLLNLGIEKAYILHGKLEEGGILDELSPNGKTLYRYVNNGTIESGELQSSDFSIQPFSIQELKVNTADDAFRKAMEIVDGNDTIGLDLIAMQGALILKMIGVENVLSKGVGIVKECFLSKKVKEFVNLWQREITF